jgi:hypothetical protein
MADLEKIDSDDLKFGEIISEEISTLLKNNIDLLTHIVPIGEMTPIMTNIPGVENPDPNIWQECDGSEITNINSPLRSIGDQKRYTPNMTDRYLKIPNIFGQSGQEGGLNDTYIFRHNHGGYTGYFTAPEDGDSSSGQYMTKKSHRHTINYSFNYAINVEPPFYTVKWYMRIQ